MPKKRKTRKEKIQREHKRQVTQDVAPSISPSPTEHVHSTQEAAMPQMTFSLPETPETQQKAPIHTKPAAPKPVVTAISTDEYDYLGKDLVRTALLTGAIVFAELLIRLFFVH